MSISGIQVVAALFGLAMVYSSYADFRRRRYGWVGFAFWEAVWLALIAVTLLPGLFQPLTHPFRARLMDIVIVLGMLVFGGVIYRMYVDQQRMHRQLEELVRTEALSGLELGSG